MNKKYAFILALFLTILISNTLFLFSHINKENNLKSIIVARVIDGDTLVTSDGETIRLANINAPEKDSPLSADSKNYLSSFTNKSIFLDAIKIEKYGRTLGRLYESDNTYINLELVNLGLSSKFLVDETELKTFNSAEDNAIQEGKGIWKTSKFANCISAEINFKDEYVLIKNSCTPIDISDWIIKDESRKQYKFKIILKDSILLHSLNGVDNSTDLFWNEKTPIWNNDRDTMYLFDKEGNLVFHKSYGY